MVDVDDWLRWVGGAAVLIILFVVAGSDIANSLSNALPSVAAPFQGDGVFADNPVAESMARTLTALWNMVLALIIIGIIVGIALLYLFFSGGNQARYGGR